MKKIYKLSPWLVTILLMLWITLTQSPFRNGGISETYTYCITGFVILIAMLIAIRYTKTNLIERIVVAIAFGVLSILLMSMYVMPPIIASLYANDTWYFWDTKHRILINAIYYGLIVADLVISFWLYFKFNLSTRKKSKQPPPIPS